MANRIFYATRSHKAAALLSAKQSLSNIAVPENTAAMPGEISSHIGMSQGAREQRSQFTIPSEASHLSHHSLGARHEQMQFYTILPYGFQPVAPDAK